MRRFDHRFRRPAVLRQAQRNPDHAVSAGPHRRPLGNKRLIFGEVITSLELVSGALTPARRIISKS
jgi:hypothetical protein